LGLETLVLGKNCSLFGAIAGFKNAAIMIDVVFYFG
jgi:hypothetical protein